MFSSLFSSKNKENADQKTVASASLTSRMKGFASKVSMILGLSAASSVAISAPSAPEMPTHNQELTAVSEMPTRPAITNLSTLPPKAPAVEEKKETPMEPVSVQPKLRMAVAQK